MGTAEIYNSAGLNDDARVLTSIPTRHNLWRREACDGVADPLVRYVIDAVDAHHMVHLLAYNPAKDT